MSFAEGSRADFLKFLNDNDIPYQQKTWEKRPDGQNGPLAIVIQLNNVYQARQVICAVKDLNAKQQNHKITIRAASGWAAKEQTHSFFPWIKAQEQQYSGSYFSSGLASSADVILQFSKSAQQVKVVGKNDPHLSADNPNNRSNPIKKQPMTIVEVTAGVQFATLAKLLKEENLSLSTMSASSRDSVFGQIATGGHGSGRDEPAISGQVRSLTICDMNGDIRKISRGDPDFEILCSAHSGMLGIVLKIELETAPGFNLKETVHHFNDVASLAKKLSTYLRENAYFTLVHIPANADENEGNEDWQVRLWNYTNYPPTTTNNKPPYTVDVRALIQEWNLKVGESIPDQLTAHEQLHDLIPSFTTLAADIVIRARGMAPRIGDANHIVQCQSPFPENMYDVGYMIPVSDKKAGPLLGEILTKMDALLLAAKSRNEHPVIYAINVGYIKGTNGGLSSTATSTDDEHILVIDIVTHPNAPGLQRFEKEFLTFLQEKGIKPRYHLGKTFPAGVNHYSDFLPENDLRNFRSALATLHGSEEALQASPFLTSYMCEMIFNGPSTHQAKMATSTLANYTKATKRSPEQFLESLIRIVHTSNALPKHKEAFIDKCREKIAAMHATAREITAG